MRKIDSLNNRKYLGSNDGYGTGPSEQLRWQRGEAAWPLHDSKGKVGERQLLFGIGMEAAAEAAATTTRHRHS
jgi:hypothetical protein